MDKDYNTGRPFLVLKEYGRNVQKLAEYLTTIQSKEERTALAHVLINLMKQLNPVVRENTGDNHQRIWDHLHFMADLKLNIDEPYPAPEEGSLYKKPRRVNYGMNRITYKHYGRNVELMIEKAIVLENPEEKLAATIYIFKLMRGFYATWNKENTEDEIILQQLKELSGGKLTLTQADLRNDAANNQERKPQHQSQQPQHQQHQNQNRQYHQGNQHRNNQDRNNQGGNNNRYNNNNNKRRK
jgi:hypothetical protein